MTDITCWMGLTVSRSHTHGGILQVWGTACSSGLLRSSIRDRISLLYLVWIRAISGVWLKLKLVYCGAYLMVSVLILCVLSQDEQRDLAKTIRVSGSILLSTVSNFLDFFKMEAGKSLDVVRTEVDLLVRPICQTLT